MIRAPGDGRAGGGPARSEQPRAPVVVVANEGSSTGLRVRGIDECKRAGAEDSSIATKTEG